MTDIPDAAIEAAARAWHEHGPNPASWDAASDHWKHGGLLRMEKAIEAAMPAIREAIAQAVDEFRKAEQIIVPEYETGLRRAARIVRGAQ